MTAAIQRLAPALVDASRYSGRHASVFATARFADLKASIAHSVGNAVPVLVSPAADGRYTLGYGELRLRACLELGLPVAAIVESLGEQDRFQRMVLSNFGTESMSAFETGIAITRALDADLYPSPRRLAEAVSCSLGEVTTALSLARLPVVVVAAFPVATAIRATWAKKLSAALVRDPEGMRNQAEQLACAASRPTAATVYAALTRGA